MSIERSTRFLLGLNAILTACLLWVHLASSSALVSSADAAPQYRSTRTTATPPPQEALIGVAGSSSRQRKQMIDELKTLNGTLASFERAMTSGSFTVQVENVEAMTLDFDYDRLAKALQQRSNQKDD